MTSKRWQDWLLLLGGVWLIAAPWALVTSSDANSSANAWTLGALVAATAWWALSKAGDKTPGWLQGAFGVWLFVAPWALGFTAVTAASWNAWILGAVLVTLACWEILEQAFAQELRAGTGHDDLAHGSP